MLHVTTLNTFLPARFTGMQRRHSVKSTIRRTFANWRQRFPRWVNTGFDEYFLLHDALPLLRDMLTGARLADPAQLAQTWVAAYHISTPFAQRAIAAVTPIAADFITRLQIEYGAQA
jgi:hypothetical protein